MSASSNLGQLIMVALAGETITTNEREILEEMQPAGITLFTRNLKNIAQITKLTDDLLNTLSTHVPIIAIDQEGGAKERLPVPPFTHWPGNPLLGEIYTKTGSDKPTRHQFAAMAKELVTLGINTNFAPIVDVASADSASYVEERVFSDQPRVVADLSVAAIEATRQYGVIPCVKHFPGHGATTVDSHQELPKIDKPLSDLKNSDLLPFQRAIAANCPVVMTAHIFYPEVDNQYPATLSESIISKLLRQELGFRELIVTDDLNMQAMASNYSLHEVAERALLAGNDLLLYCEGVKNGYEVYRHLQTNLKNQQLSPQLVDAVERAQKNVIAWKAKHLANAPRPNAEQAEKLTNDPKHQSLPEAIVKQRVA